MASALPTKPKKAVTTAFIPPLQNGDRLSRAEFERRYEAMPNVKAELIEGVVYMASPVRQGQHGRQHSHLHGWLTHYLALTEGLDVGDNSTIRLDLDNAPQPDALLMYLPEHKGQARVDEDDYIEGAPELIAEVAASSASYDLHIKLHVYRRNGVREYVVWRVLDEEIDWFILRDGTYERLPLSPDGIFRSEIFPGLWLDPEALIAGELVKVFEVVQQGVAARNQSPS
jgi:Uma2 family endonuclease